MDSLTNIFDDRYNFYCRGLLPDIHYRFVLARNSAATTNICKKHTASYGVCALMGEAMMGSFFLASHFEKQQNLTVSLHLECDGPVKRIIASANSEGGIRAMSSHPEENLNGDLRKGKGLLTVNRWKDDEQKVYSSTVEMRDTTIDKNLEEYIGKSEQVQSFIKMETSCDSRNSTNISGYPHSMLFALGQKSAEESLQNDGKIEIQCEFCKKYYYFTQEDVSTIFRRN
jgi:redox-regulated HSP33 family molecular chaperone